MSTYKNCYALVASVRRALGEYSEAKVRGEDTLGGFDNDYIVEKINETIRELYAMIARRVPDLFLEEVDLTGVNSVYTLPWDFGRLIYFKNNEGVKVTKIDETQRRLTNSTGSEMTYRRVGNTLVLDQAGGSKVYTLIYMRKPRIVHHGLVVAGSALSMTFCTQAPKIADYFNGMVVENITGDWVDTVSDYSAARVATIAAETPALNEAYGLVPEIPDWSHDLIAPRASLAIRMEHPLAKRKPNAQDILKSNDMLRSTLVEFTAPGGDQEYEDIFTNFGPKVGGVAI